MKTPKNPYLLLGRIFAGVGGALLLLCLTLALALRGQQDFWLFLLPFGINGAVLSCIGLGFLLYQRRKRARQEELFARGEAVSARVVGLEPNASIRVNGRSPMRLLCRYEENGVSYLCRSDNLPGYPRLCRDTVTVYRDPYDIKRYYVDVSDAITYDVEL